MLPAGQEIGVGGEGDGADFLAKDGQGAAMDLLQDAAVDKFSIRGRAGRKRLGRGEAAVGQLAGLDQPVDRLALADNLLRSLQLDLALQIYQQLDGELPAPEDQAWIRYQIANCHRLSGRLNEAKKVFRELTNSGREDFPVPLARWWLTAIDRQADLMARSQRFEEILQSFPGAPGHAQ